MTASNAFERHLAARPDDRRATTAGTRTAFWWLGVRLVAALLAVVATGRRNRPLADAVR
ncbi:hypothetical protein [Actinomyces succiniciruminis]|uniref:Uncharacterized protein n=1 Tax=Actinomyces succiniciruminis TaxID=1522002 RepID=A0A1L7RSE0_9ACTO|nr:hypothetical protein [Actinomyces succiniciruminis]CED92528.1 Hypothetical protein AAM4_2696 [Actinomyces succiniciruminis]